MAELHKLKTDIFMDLVQRGTMPLRPGVQRLVRGSPHRTRVSNQKQEAADLAQRRPPWLVAAPKA